MRTVGAIFLVYAVGQFIIRAWIMKGRWEKEEKEKKKEKKENGENVEEHSTVFVDHLLDDGVIVQFFYFLFDDLRYLSLFQWLRILSLFLKNKKDKKNKENKKIEDGEGDKKKGKDGDEDKSFIRSYLFPELWPFIMLIVSSVILMNMNFVRSHKALCYLAIAFAILRPLAIFVYHVNVLFFDPMHKHYDEKYKNLRAFSRLRDEQGPTTKADEQKEYAIKSVTRMIILLILNMIEYVLAFSIIYCIMDGTQSGISTISVILQSMSLFTNLDSPTGLPDSAGKDVLSVANIEAITGLFMNLLCLARFIGTIPGIKSVDDLREVKR